MLPFWLSQHSLAWLKLARQALIRMAVLVATMQAVPATKTNILIN
ncbi:hypothetical protein CIWKM_11_03750 [Citrobacter werkmanii NBRC 105721]|nr:hypothetical protein CIWKM_11_03750 [Citrobacter werkmanii NBRC 105721]